MRHCVLRHHVCLCVLSTAMLAGFALLTEQREVYAAKNYCKAITSGGDDDKWRIECDGGKTGTVAGNRTIDMGTEASEPAVKVYKSGRGGKDIRITGDVLKITGSGSNKNPAIQVYQQGVLTVNNVTMTDVHKGIEVKDSGSSVTVLKGSIGVRRDGVSVIEVKNGGKVTLNDGVKTVTGGGGAESTGIVVGEGGGNVTVMTKSFSNVKTGIKFNISGTGRANATVSGGAERATMTVIAGGTGITMERMATGTANVMNMTVKGQNSGTGVDMKNGTLELNKVGVSNFTTGAQVSDGMLTVMGGEINGKSTGVDMTGGVLTVTGKSRIVGSTMGAQVSDGMLTVNGNSTIQVTTGTGLSVTGGGTANVTGGTIMASGGAGIGQGTGVESSGTVTLTSVEVSGFEKGISVTGEGTVTVMGKSEIKGKSVGAQVSKGTLTVSGNSTITGKSVGVSVEGGEFVAFMSKEGKIEVQAGGTGLKVTGVGIANVTGGKIMASGSGIGQGTGVEVNTSGEDGVKLNTVTVSNFATGISVTSGTVTVNGKSTIKGTTMGVSVTKGTFVASMGGDGKIEVQAGGTGLKVMGTGTANVMGTTIMASGGGGITGVEAGGKTVMLSGVMVTGFEKGAIVTSGKLEVSGKSKITGKSMGVEVKGGTFMMGESIIQVEANGTGVGLKVERDGTANVMNSAITAQGGSGTGGATGVEVNTSGGEGVTLDGVTVSNFATGISVTGEGTVTVMGKSEIKGKSVGVEVKGGKFVMGAGSGIVVEESNGVGLKVERDGTANVMNSAITAQGGSGTGGATGVEVNTSGGEGVTLDGVTVTEFKTGISVKSGTFKMTRGSIKGTGSGSVGVYALGAETMTMTLTGVKISNVDKGVYARGKVVTISGGTRIEGVGMGIMMMRGRGTLKINEGTTIEFKGDEDYGVGVGMWGGITAKLTKTRIRGQNRGVGVMGKGVGKEVTLEDVTISQVGAGVVMEGDGTLTIRGESSVISFTGGDGVGVGVGDGMKSASLNDVTIRGGGSGGMGVYARGAGYGELTVALDKVKIEGVMTGVVMTRGESLTISGGSMTNVRMGVMMMGGGTLIMQNKTRIEFTGSYGVGVYVAGAVKSANLDDVKITGGGEGSIGVYATGTEEMVLTNVTTEGVKTGVAMTRGEMLVISGDSTINFTGDYGVYMGDGVTSASLSDVTIKGEGGKYGVYAEETEEMVLTEVKVEGVKTGVAMTKGGMLVISGERSVISFVGDYGVYVKNTAMVELAKTRIIGQNSGRGGNNGVKYGVYATGGDVTMTLNDVTIEEVKTGITMLGGGLKVSGGSIKGVTTGIAMSGSGTLMVEKGTEIQFTKGYGVMVGGGVTVGERVTAKLTETTIRGEGKGSTGVYVAGGDALLEQVKIEGSNQATGLYVTQGAVRLQNTTLRDVAMGMTISQGVVMMEGGSIEFTDRYGISVSGGQAVLSGFKIIKKGNEDTDKSTGVWVDNSGKVMMRGVDISGVQMGAYVMETGLLVMDKGSIDFKGEYGIYTSLQNSP